MRTTKRVVCVIPARLASTRFPQKALALLAGKPLLQWIWEAATSIDLFDEVTFAVDAQEIADVIKSFGGRYQMTSVACKSGTDRLVELAIQGKLKADVWVNWQGDEPFIHRAMIETLLQSIDRDDAECWTLVKRITNPEDITSPKVAKVVWDKQGLALYFSRAPIPFFRDERDLNVLVTKNSYYKHVGLYAYSSQALKKIATMGDSILEDAEKLEQLRFLDYGLRFKVHETDQEVFGIDTPEDLAKAERLVHQKKR